MNGVDLETSFPDYFNHQAKSNQHLEPEVQAIKDWSSTNQFVLSGHFKSGGLSATFPFLNPQNSVITFTKRTQTPDHDVFQHLASTFMKSNPKSDQDYECQVMFQNYFYLRPHRHYLTYVEWHSPPPAPPPPLLAWCFVINYSIHSFSLKHNLTA